MNGKSLAEHGGLFTRGLEHGFISLLFVYLFVCLGVCVCAVITVE